MRESGRRDIQTMTLAFGEFRGRAEDEAPLARKWRSFYSTRPRTRIVTEAEFEVDLPRILGGMDQPFIDGINTWFVSKTTHKLGLEVAISGLGRDELLGGHPSFRDIPRWVALLAVPSCMRLLGKALRMEPRPLVGAVGGSLKSADLLGLGGNYAGAYPLRRGLFLAWELDQVLDCDLADQGLRWLAPLGPMARDLELGPRSAHARVANLEAALYTRSQHLRDTDWASMARGLEVRVPLVDAVLLRRVAAAVRATAASREANPKASLALSPSKPLPFGLVSKAKTSFTTTIAGWLQCGMLRTAVPRCKVPRTAHLAERLAVA
jgi:asparagine synthase (glutamine-hydrolysing)